MSSVYLIAAVTAAYLGVAVSEYLKGNIGMCVTFAGYSVANIGLIMVAWN